MKRILCQIKKNFVDHGSGTGLFLKILDHYLRRLCFREKADTIEFFIYNSFDYLSPIQK